ncbi:FAD binding domain [seawater metagenome]|uniref:UDP-N-acetylmuramate dehydrogenase n=1 Tax=seawater metagenome TaxID=1561972 RepID=A0A5E8CLK4_9ZZZZ
MNLKKYNWFKIDAICHSYYEINNVKELEEIVIKAQQMNLKIFILGDGSNVLLNENLNNYIVIKLINKDIFYIEYKDHYMMSVDAGYQIDELVKFGIKLNIPQIVNFSGIPGTIGGATVMNIHYKNFFLSDFIDQITVFDTIKKEILTFNSDEIKFTYKHNFLKEKPNYIVISIFLKFKKENNVENLNITRKKILEARNKRYPSNNTCGCFFYNLDNLNGKQKSTGYQIEKANIESQYKFTNVFLHSTHKNMFVTNNKCSSSEIISLANFIKKTIKKELGYTLIPECRFIGFKDEEN